MNPERFANHAKKTSSNQGTNCLQLTYLSRRSALTTFVSMNDEYRSDTENLVYHAFSVIDIVTVKMCFSISIVFPTIVTDAVFMQRTNGLYALFEKYKENPKRTDVLK